MSAIPDLRDWQWARFHSYLLEAVEKQSSPELSEQIVANIKAGNFRILSRFAADEIGAPVRDTHCYVFQLLCADGWSTLFTLANELLNLTDEQLDDEVAHAVKHVAALN